MLLEKNIKPICLFLALIFCVLIPPSYSAEQNISGVAIQTRAHFSPQISAPGYIVIDVDTRQILAQKNAHQSNPPASLTKIMTALVAYENLTLEQEISVSNKAARMDPSKMYLFENEKIKTSDLLNGLLIASANDAAVALAEAVSGSEGEFAKLMNEKADKLGLQDSNFENSSGMDQMGHFSSPYDIAILSLELLDQPFFTQIISTSQTSVYSADQQFKHNLRNTNQALVYEGVIGIKTGSTDEAGQTLSLLVQREDKKILAVFFGSQDRLRDADTIINWTYDSNTWQQYTIPYCSFSWKEIMLTTQIQEKECFSNSLHFISPVYEK